MNQKAQELNMKNTNFVTPNGLDDENHYSTAYDMAILTNYALKNEKFKEIVGTKTTNVAWKGGYRTISNTNELLGNYPGVYGVKTGFTFGAGRCLISACKQNDLDIIVVVLGANTKKDRTADSIKILNYINTNYQMVDISSTINTAFENYKDYFAKRFNTEKIINDPNIKLEEINNTLYPIKKQELSLLQTKAYTFLNFSEEIQENTKIGVLQVYINDNLLAQYNILLANNLIKKNFRYYIIDIVKNYFNYICMNGF